MQILKGNVCLYEMSMDKNDKMLVANDLGKRTGSTLP